MTILVTGASGLIGTELITQLAREGRQVIALARRSLQATAPTESNIRWIFGDLANNVSVLADLPPLDAVVHLAGTGWARGARADETLDEDAFILANELATVNLLRTLANKTERFVLASSQVVYGSPNSLAVSEDCALDASASPYATSKLNGENWMRYYQRRHGGTYLAMRFCGFLEGGGLVDYLIDRAINNEEIQLYSSGQICRDYLPVADAATALKLGVDAQLGEGFISLNIGSGQSLKSHDLALLVCEAVGSSSAIVVVDKPSPQSNFVFRVEKARKLLGFEPSNLAEAVRKRAYDRMSLNTNGRTK